MTDSLVDWHTSNNSLRDYSRPSFLSERMEIVRRVHNLVVERDQAVDRLEFSTNFFREDEEAEKVKRDIEQFLKNLKARAQSN